MAKEDFKAAFRAAKSDLEAAQQKLGKLQEEVIETEAKIAELRSYMPMAAKFAGEEYDEADALGLTDAIRQVFRTHSDASIVVTDVRDLLRASGFDITKYGNVLASVHSVVNRLVDKGEIREFAKIGGKPAYGWVRRK